MKFTLLWKDTEAARKSIDEWWKSGRASDGITLMRVDGTSIIDKFTGKFVENGNILRCKGSIFSYLAYKLRTGKTAWIGWGDYPK